MVALLVADTAPSSAIPCLVHDAPRWVLPRQGSAVAVLTVPATAASTVLPHPIPAALPAVISTAAACRAAAAVSEAAA